MTRIFSILLLAIVGTAALYGGVLLIADPSGWKIGFSTSILKHSPFTDFFIPGLILFLLLGLGSLTVCSLVLMRIRHYPIWTSFIGFSLSVWISIQMLLLRSVDFTQVVTAVAGILLIVLGILERHKELNS